MIRRGVRKAALFLHRQGRLLCHLSGRCFPVSQGTPSFAPAPSLLPVPAALLVLGKRRVARGLRARKAFEGKAETGRRDGDEDDREHSAGARHREALPGEARLPLGEAVRGIEGPSAWLAAFDPEDGALAVVKVVPVRDASGGFPPEDLSGRARAEAEAAAFAHVASLGDVPDARVRFDLLCLAAAGCSRVLIRHHVDAFGGG